MSEMYRQCEIMWDAETTGDGYITSVPRYFHGWFRLLGLLVLSGNYHAPLSIKPSANMKVYLNVDKTCASKDDEITYTIPYRNYGSVDALDVVIIDTISSGLSYVSSTGSGTFDASSNTVTWNIGTVPGFKTETGISPTVGEFSVTVSVDDGTKGRSVNRAAITCSNGTGWITNEYPNLISPDMKRNFVDIIDPPANPESGFIEITRLHGGRAGVRFSCSFNGEASDTMRTLRIRAFNDAQEAYICYGNYRVSLFLYSVWKIIILVSIPVILPS